MMKTQDSTAVTIARAHINAWSHHDWGKTRELLAPNVHAVVTTTQPMKATAELTGIDAYMEHKKGDKITRRREYPCMDLF